MNSFVLLVVLVLSIILLGVSAWRLAIFNAANRLLINPNYLPDFGINLNQTSELLAIISINCKQENDLYECSRKKIKNSLALWGTLVAISSIVLLFCVIKLAINFKNKKKSKKKLKN